jgi:succinate dehydrogenase/fumarate reductase flavoprotein subunit
MGNGIGDGYALAHLAGVELTNIEFIQFALGLETNGTRKFLPIGQLNESCKIVDSLGCDILGDYMPDESQKRQSIRARMKHMPFSCRDTSGQVDIAVASALRSEKNIYWQNCVTKSDRSQVTHFAHAFNGGVKINPQGESSVPGLYAAGEVAAGPHGADRIGGCMMTATQVFGKRAGQFAAERAKNSKRKDPSANCRDGSIAYYQSGASADALQAFSAIENRVKTAMSQYAGILRNKKGLIRCKKLLETFTNQLNALEIMGLSNSHRYYIVRNMIITADLVVQSALARKESKGSHYREDDRKAHS